MYADELHAVFAVYRQTGRLPEAPDRALSQVLAPAGYDPRAHWYERLTPAELARLRDAIDRA